MGARNSEINIPAAQTPPSQIHAMRISPAKASPCASRLGPGVCGAPCVAAHHPGAAILVVAVTGAALVTPYRTIAIPQTNERTNERLHVPWLLLLPLCSLRAACPMLPVAAKLAAVLGLRSASHSPTGSHRMPSPSVRPVTRERSPKRVLQVVCGWCTGACWLPRLGLECPGSILPSFDPPCTQACPGLPSWDLPRCLAAATHLRQTRESTRARRWAEPDLMIATHAILS